MTVRSGGFETVIKVGTLRTTPEQEETAGYETGLLDDFSSHV